MPFAFCIAAAAAATTPAQLQIRDQPRPRQPPALIPIATTIIDGTLPPPTATPTSTMETPVLLLLRHIVITDCLHFGALPACRASLNQHRDSTPSGTSSFDIKRLRFLTLLAPASSTLRQQRREHICDVACASVSQFAATPRLQLLPLRPAGMQLLQGPGSICPPERPSLPFAMMAMTSPRAMITEHTLHAQSSLENPRHRSASSLTRNTCAHQHIMRGVKNGQY